jgi:excisionase family DNA binding protein
LIVDQNPSAGPMMSVNPAKPTPLEDKFILTSEEAAEFLGVSLRTIRYWVATRRVPYFHLGRFIRFKPADLTAFLESGRVEPLEHQRTVSTASTAHGGAAWRAE